jgi:hypothetical protein
MKQLVPHTSRRRTRRFACLCFVVVSLQLWSLDPANAACFLHVLLCECMRLKAWFAVRKSLRLARMPRSARMRFLRCLRATLAAVPVLFAHALAHAVCRMHAVLMAL